MNKYIRILILSCFFLFYETNSLKCNTIIDNIFLYRDNMWYKIDYTYSDKKLIKIEIKKSLDSIKWENFEYSNFEYNNSNLYNKETYKWENNNWKGIYFNNNLYKEDKISKREYKFIKDAIKNVLTYKYSKNELTIIDSLYKNDFFIKNIETKYAYKASLIDSIKIKYNNNKDIILFKYNKNNKIIEINNIEYSNIDTSYFKTLINYNITGDEDCEVNYNFINDHWIPFTKLKFNYTENRQIKDVFYYSWEQRYWKCILKRKYVYDESCNILFHQILLPKFNTWKNFYTSNYEYNNDKISKIYLENKFWSDINLIYQDFIPINNCNYKYIYGKEIYIKYININNYTNINYPEYKIKIFPNPSKNGIFKYESKLLIKYIQIYDLNGYLIYNLDNPEYINLSNLNSGIYIAKFYTDKNIYSSKLIINK